MDNGAHPRGDGGHAVTRIAQVPPLSVVMPVFNAGRFLAPAIDSILGQSFGDFEFVIYDDGSTDGSLAVAQAFARADARVRVVAGTTRHGPVGSSQAAAEAARAGIVARMDADDIAHVDRLKLQLQALAACPQATVVGSLYALIDRDGHILCGRDRGQLARSSAVLHCSMMYRRAAWQAAGGYRAGTDLVEDVDLQQRLARIGPRLVVPQTLMSYRVAGQSFRASEDVASIEQRMNLQFPAPRSERAGTASEKRPIAREVYHTIALLRVYGGIRPGILWRALTRMRLSPWTDALRTLTLVALATISPGLARYAIRLAAALRDRLAAGHVAEDHLYLVGDDGLVDLGAGFRRIDPASAR